MVLYKVNAESFGVLSQDRCAEVILTIVKCCDEASHDRPVGCVAELIVRHEHLQKSQVLVKHHLNHELLQPGREVVVVLILRESPPC